MATTSEYIERLRGGDRDPAMIDSVRARIRRYRSLAAGLQAQGSAQTGPQFAEEADHLESALDEALNPS